MAIAYTRTNTQNSNTANSAVAATASTTPPNTSPTVCAFVRIRAQMTNEIISTCDQGDTATSKSVTTTPVTLDTWTDAFKRSAISRTSTVWTEKSAACAARTRRGGLLTEGSTRADAYKRERVRDENRNIGLRHTV